MAKPHNLERHQPALRSPSTLEQAIAKRLGREKRPIRIEIEMAFGGHGDAEDIEQMRLRERIANADLILLEGVGRPKNVEQIFMALSKGHAHPKDVAGGEFEWAIGDLLYNTKKVVTYWDISRDHPLFAQMEKTKLEMLHTLFTRRLPLEQGVEVFGKLIEEFIQVEGAREEATLALLEPTIARAIRENPKLATKNPLRILTVYGSFHTKLNHEVRKRHPDTSRSFPTSPYTWSYLHELMRTYRFGKTPHEEKVRKALLGAMLTDELLVLMPRNKEDLGSYSAKERAAVDLLYPHIAELYAARVLEQNAGKTLGIMQRHLEPFLAASASEQ